MHEERDSCIVRSSRRMKTKSANMNGSTSGRPIISQSRSLYAPTVERGKKYHCSRETHFVPHVSVQKSYKEKHHFFNNYRTKGGRFMVSAFILAKMESGKEQEVFSRIGEMSDIKQATVTYGLYDLLIGVDFDKIEDLDGFVFNVLRRIPGIKETVTMIAVRSIS